jgi:tryptophanase
VAKVIVEVYKNREKIKGLQIEYEAPALRHFTVRMKEVG